MRKLEPRRAPRAPRPKAEELESDLTPEERYRAVAFARDSARGTAERLAAAKEELDSMRSLNYPRRLVDPLMLEAQGAAVRDLEAWLVDANEALERALRFFDESPGDETYWLDRIGENNRALEEARALEEHAILRERVARRREEESEFLPEARRAAVLAAQELAELAAEITRRSERAQLLSGGLALARQRRRPERRPKVEVAPGARVLRASGSLTCNGVHYEAGDAFSADEVRRIRPRNLDVMLERGLVYWHDPAERLVVARRATIGGRQYEPGDPVERADVARNAPVLLSERRIRRGAAMDDDLPPAA